MRLTTKGRYAVTAMLDLALQEGRRPVTLQDIAVNQEISLSYLEQLFARLRRNGLVRGTRGPGGERQEVVRQGLRSGRLKTVVVEASSLTSRN